MRPHFATLLIHYIFTSNKAKRRGYSVALNQGHILEQATPLSIGDLNWILGKPESIGILLAINLIIAPHNP